MDLRPLCKYGEKCYRQNQQHQKQYKHPKSKRKRDDEEDEEIVKKNKIDDEAVDETKCKNSDDEDIKKHVESGSSKADPENEEEKEAKSDSVEREESEPVDDEADDSEAPLSPEDIKENIKQKYLAEFPEDFYQIWEFCKKENPGNPEGTFKSTLGFTLVGPFDILAGKHKGVKINSRGKRPNYLLHWRYYYDPPEFTTIINGDRESQFHLGYYRDDPAEMPAFVAANSAKENGNIVFRGQNLFASIKYFLEEKIKSKDVSSDLKKRTESLLKRFKEYAEEHSMDLDYKSQVTKNRDKKVVCKTLHGAGIVVPVDENDVGYRPVPETPADLRKMFKKIAESKTDKERDKNFEPLQELITYIQFANDECDYGEGLELGLDLFTHGGSVFHTTILSLLPLAYQLLRRDEYSKIIEAHLKKRRHIADLSELV